MRLSGTVLLLSLLASSASADDSLWQLAYEDNFDRTELGDDWSLRSGQAEIVDGRLHLHGHTPIAMITRSFKPDVKITFEAEADPAHPPCDLSIAMAGSPLKGYGHLLAFGGQSNRANQIVGGGAHAVDDKPEMLIEPGRRYRLVGIKEGKRLALYVDDKLLVEATVKDPLAGPGFDHVGLVSWNGMFVDNVKVYERTKPTPDTPVVLETMPDFGFDWSDRKLTYTGAPLLDPPIQRGIELYNQRKYTQAAEVLGGFEPPTPQSVAALAYVLGDIGCVVRPEQQDRLVALARQVADRDPDNAAAADFLQAAEWFHRVRIFPRNRIACERLAIPGPDNNPFYYKARLFIARFHHASALEGGDRKRVGEAVEMFKELKEMWPEHEGLRGFTGDRIPWGDELIHDESDGPAWARYLQEAFARQNAVLNWWFTERQFPDGQLGGGWGDDVELLRSWTLPPSITTASETVTAGIERMAEGVWRDVLVDGFTPDPGDVEHSAEPSADSMPTMIMLRYGDPLWVERNLRSAKTMRERMMGINERGHLQFKSTYIGSEGAIEHARAGGDTGYHARAMKHFIWLAWYGVPEAKSVFLHWCDTWYGVTMREIGNKPAGFVPASIWWPSGGIDPPTGRPWYDDRSHSYGFPGLGQMIHRSFLTAYFLSGDYRYLDPVATMMDLATVGPLRRNNPDLPPDHIDNLLSGVAHNADRDTLAIYRWLTGQRVYDEYLRRHANALLRYQMDHDIDAYARSFEGLAKGMRHNWAMRTSEVLQTDRAGVAGADTVFGAYTGGVCSFRDARPPTLAVSFDTPNLNFAALVTEATTDRVRIRMYNFNDAPMRTGIRLWRLQPGIYVLNTGEPVPGEHDFQKRYTWTGAIEVDHARRGTPVYIDVPSHKEWVVDFRLRQPVERPAALCDLAIHDRDIERDGDAVHVTVHNIGSAAAPTFSVTLDALDGELWSQLDRVDVVGLPEITKLEPVRERITLKLPAGQGGKKLRVRVDPRDAVDELYELNNAASVN